MINLYHLTTFCTVLNEGSMTAAANKLFLTQPAVSQQIRNLEEEQGVELLVRGVRKVKPTLQGQLLYEYSKKIINLAQQAEVAVKAIGREIRGNLSIGTLNSVGLHMISPVVGMFLKHNSELQLKLDYSRGEDVIQAIREGGLDVAILPDTEVEYSTDLPETEKMFLMKEEMWLIATGKDSSIPKRISFKDFASLPVVMFSKEYPGFSKKLQQELYRHQLSVDPVFESSNVGTLKRVIESGLGWGFLPAHCIRKQVRSGRLVRVLVDDLDYQFDYNFHYQRQLQDSPVIDVLFNAIQHQNRVSS